MAEDHPRHGDEPTPPPPEPSEPDASKPADGTEPPTSRDLGDTREQPPGDATAVQPAATDPWAETAPEPQPPPPAGPGGTSVMPAVPGPPGATPGAPRWSARAQVPQPDTQETVESAGYGGGYYEQPPGRRLGTPILIAVLVLLLLAAIAFGA